MNDEHPATSVLRQDSDAATWSEHSQNPLVLEIIEVLALHPRGLRRWSVMRAIRNNREAASREIPLKLEADVERMFRRLCAGSDASRCTADNALFFRPEEKAGEVWAVHPDRATAWLGLQPVEAEETNQ